MPGTPSTPTARPRLHKQGWLRRGLRKVCTSDDVKVPILQCIPCELTVTDKHVLRHTRTANHKETLPEFLSELQEKGMPRNVLDDEADEIGELLKAEVKRATPSRSKARKTPTRTQTPVKGYQKWNPLSLWLAEGVSLSEGQNDGRQFVCAACSTPEESFEIPDDRHSLCRHILTKRHRDRLLPYLSNLVQSPDYLASNTHPASSLTPAPSSSAAVSASSPALNGYRPTAKPSRARATTVKRTPRVSEPQGKPSDATSARGSRASRRGKAPAGESPPSTPSHPSGRRSRVKAFPPRPEKCPSQSPQPVPPAEPSLPAPSPPQGQELPLVPPKERSPSPVRDPAGATSQKSEVQVKLERESPPPVIIARATVKRDLGELELDVRYEKYPRKKKVRRRSVSLHSEQDESMVNELL
ncbi:hypothetical protein L202_02192 [Cryptococcus amylolentus CBS 6039]|uniref:Uncharacterized protein n=1 Tax=Cryptococcus amylolentus CBS 6039 TaxID=1295533 RepID=A0A1E3HZZ4_9TREE|nr:hypothetical protein L202_02192 [Cryptococcus amylolentus CBS 6039]ODN81828.1 hypothetical protein L202_02192 [Cryptococcus amylolentus CBS 6039]